MNNFLDIDWSDVLEENEKTNKASFQPLEEMTQNNDLPKDLPGSCYIEITLCYPHTKSFINKRQDLQKGMYRKIYSVISSMYKNIIHTNKFVFENTKQGVIHLHSYWKLHNLPNKFSVAGLLSDIAKVWLSALPAKYNNFLPACIFYFDEDDTVCYRCPSIKITMRVNQESREEEWVNYIMKTLK